MVIKTYKSSRSHIGKTKARETFEKFLGPKEYNEKLFTFDRFLHTSFCKYHYVNFIEDRLTLLIAPEDCASQSLVKGEIQDEGQDEWSKDNDEESLGTGGGVGELENDKQSSRVEEKKTSISSQYLQDKEKNVAELKKALNEIKAKYPILEAEDLGLTKASKKSGSKKKKGLMEE